MKTSQSTGLATFDTAAGLWPRLVTHAGLTGPRQGGRGPYDSALIADLQQKLFPGQTGDIDALISSSDLSAEALLRAFFATLEPFARMKEDILAMLAEAGARASGDILRIRFDFNPGQESLDLLLEQFRAQMDAFVQVSAPAFPAIDYPVLWRLAKAGFEGDLKFSHLPSKVGPAGVLDWLDTYGDGASFLPILDGWRTGDADLDDRIGRVVDLMNALLARFSLHGRTHDELHRAADEAGPDMRDDSGFSVYELWIIESDFWPRAIGAWICQVHEAHRAGDLQRLSMVIATVDELLPATAQSASSLIKILEDILDLPVWKHRHEVYAVWLGAQMHRALSEAGWRFRFHLVDHRLEFAFRGVHLATLVRSDSEPELYWWTELRTDHADLPNDRRSTGIQPDYRILRSPLSASNRDVLVIEAKQHLRSDNKEFREAIEDYAHACPDAGVLLANHGRCSASLMSKVSLAARPRSEAYGNIHPGNPENIEAFRKDVVRVLDGALAGNPAKGFELPCEVQLTWAAIPADLDLHIFATDGGHVFYQAPQLGAVTLGPDVTSGYGPETASLGEWAGNYLIAVHQYSAEGDLSESQAVVEITSGRRSQRSCSRFEIPAGEGNWWKVAEIDLARGRISPVQQRTTSAAATASNVENLVPRAAGSGCARLDLKASLPD